jgi:hypothetical protein
MFRKLKNIVSLLLLLVFLLPSIVKLEHHHEHFEYKASNEKHSHILHDKCIICNFEFPVFLFDFADFDFHKENPSEYFCNNYDSVYYSNFSQFSFLLRAPPLLTNRI